jgi:hypothetical protein
MQSCKQKNSPPGTTVVRWSAMYWAGMPSPDWGPVGFFRLLEPQSHFFLLKK